MCSPNTSSNCCKWKGSKSRCSEIQQKEIVYVQKLVTRSQKFWCLLSVIYDLARSYPRKIQFSMQIHDIGSLSCTGAMYLSLQTTVIFFCQSDKESASSKYIMSAILVVVYRQNKWLAIFAQSASCVIHFFPVIIGLLQQNAGLCGLYFSSCFLLKQVLTHFFSCPGCF